MRDTYIKTRMSKHLKILSEFCEKNSCDFAALFLQGSQNYELDEYSNEYQSDVDTKAIIIPSLQNIIDGTSPISTTLVTDDNEHIDVKDIRIWIQMWEKQNISYLEVLFTNFFLVRDEYLDLIERLQLNADRISRFNETAALKCMVGMVREKMHALKHPYPSALEKIEKFGYDPKQLHHICRLMELTQRYINGESLHSALIPDGKDYLMKLKKGTEPGESVDYIANQWASATENIVDTYISSHPTNIDSGVKTILYDIKSEMIRRYIKSLLLKED